MTKPKKAPKPVRAKKPTKAETVEVNVGGTEGGVQLLLGNIVGQRDREYYAETYLKLKAKAATANSAVRDFKKRGVEAGVNMQALDNVLRLEKMDALDLADLLKQQAAFIRDRGLPVQVSLFEPKFGSPDAQAEKLGYDCGYRGDSPLVDMYPPETPCHDAMMRGWHSGQRQLVEDQEKHKAAE